MLYVTTRSAARPDMAAASGAAESISKINPLNSTRTHRAILRFGVTALIGYNHRDGGQKYGAVTRQVVCHRDQITNYFAAPQKSAAM
jgi:hypothetical protein